MCAWRTAPFSLQENATKPEGLPPSQGGKYVGFGSAPAPRPKPAAGGVDDLTNLLSSTLTTVTRAAETAAKSATLAVKRWAPNRSSAQAFQTVRGPRGSTLQTPLFTFHAPASPPAPPQRLGAADADAAGEARGRDAERQRQSGWREGGARGAGVSAAGWGELFVLAALNSANCLS